jgi:hypothetical protein
MITMFQSIGIVFSLILLVVVTLATLYLSYIVGIGLVILSLVYITYHLLKTVKSPTVPKEGLSSLAHFQ